MPRISVIMPAYNAEKYIAQAIESILGQTYGDFELIIINDCSQDRTEEIILSYDDPRIIYLKNAQNLGVAKTLNLGLEIAKSEYIARMDADDIAIPERFVKQIAFLDSNADVAVLGCSVLRFSDYATLGLREFACNPDQMAVDMLFACGVAHPSVMMRAEVIRELGGYDPEFNGLEDYELWCRVLEKHQITTLPDILLKYRIHEKQVTKNPSEQYLTMMRMLRVRNIQRLGLDPVRAEAFLRFCEDGRPGTIDKIRELDEFFAIAYAANEDKQIYNAKLLHNLFMTIIQSCAMNCAFHQQCRLVANCKHLTLPGLVLSHLKRNVKKFVAAFGRQQT